MTEEKYASPYEPYYEEPYPEHLSCFRCGMSLADWHGNVMVEREAWRRSEVDGLRVWCKQCTRDADEALGISNVPHAIWELIWIKDDPAGMVDGVLLQVANPGGKHWSPEAIEDFRHLYNAAVRPGAYPSNR